MGIRIWKDCSIEFHIIIKQIIFVFLKNQNIYISLEEAKLKIKKLLRFKKLENIYNEK